MGPPSIHLPLRLWVMVRVAPPMVTVPVRALESGFWGMLNVTEPLLLEKDMAVWVAQPVLFTISGDLQ